MSEERGEYRTNGRARLCRGFLYRGEIILVVAFGAAVIWPTWLNGLQLAFNTEGEARNFVDAYASWMKVSNELFVGAI